MSDYDTARAEAQAKADREAGRCPGCGGPVSVDLIDVTYQGSTTFLPGIKHCVDECWRTDPDRYYAAVEDEMKRGAS